MLGHMSKMLVCPSALPEPHYVELKILQIGFRTKILDFSNYFEIFLFLFPFLIVP